MAEGGWKMLASMLECSICQEELKQPRVLPCQHTFCSNCLDQCLKHHVRDGSLPCPICRAPYKVTQAGVDAISKNIFVNNLIEAAHSDGLAEREQSDGTSGDQDIIPQCSVEPEECSQPAVIYCKHCEEYMCKDCEAPHRSNKYTKKHKTMPAKDVSVKHKLPQCPAHDHMYLDLYCEDCDIPMCATCAHLEHREHTCTNLSSRMEGFQCQLDEVLDQTERCLQAVNKAIKATQHQATKAEADVEALKQQTSASYQAIQQQVKKQEEKHLSEIDQAYQQAQKVIAETIDTQQTMEVTLTSIKLYGRKLKKQGTAYDFTTNLKCLVKRSEQEASKPPPELKWGVDVRWYDWEGKHSVKGVKLVRGGGERGSGSDSTRLLGKFITQCQNVVRGIVSCGDNLIMVHQGHDVIYVYGKGGEVKSSVKVKGMRDPWGLCLVQTEGTTQHLVVTDWGANCLWWLRVEEQGGQVRLGQPHQHKLVYEPVGVSTDRSGQALVCDVNNRRLYMYRQPGHEGAYIQLPQDVTPWQAISDPAGGYVVRDPSGKLLWVNAAGQVTRRYTDQPAVSVMHMVHNGTDLLVADDNNHCVHVVTGEGKHGGHLLTQQQGIKDPSCICVDAARHRLWLCHCGQDNKWQVMKVDYSPPDVTSLTLSVTLPKLNK